MRPSGFVLFDSYTERFLQVHAYHSLGDCLSKDTISLPNHHKCPAYQQDQTDMEHMY